MVVEVAVDDNAFTNALVLTNIARIRWRRYYHVCHVTELQWKLAASTSQIPGHSASLQDPLLNAHLALLAAGIPCAWRLGDYDPTQKSHNGRPTRLYAKSTMASLTTTPEGMSTRQVPEAPRNHYIGEENVRLAYCIYLYSATSPMGMGQNSPQATPQSTSPQYMPASPYSVPVPGSELPTDFSPIPAIMDDVARPADPNTYDTTGDQNELNAVEDGVLSRELWIFEFGDLKLQQCPELQKLTELEAGWFSSDNVYNTLGLASNAPCTVEYSLFINAMHNLLERSFTKNGVVRIGHQFIIPQNVSQTPSASWWRMAGEAQHLASYGLLVLSPSGVTALASLSDSKEGKPDEWSSVLNVVVGRQESELPSYLLARIPDSNITCMYPTNLIFVPVKSEGQNQPSEKDVARSQWKDASVRATKLFPAMSRSDSGQNMDYWDYVSLSRNVTDLVLEKAGTIDPLLIPPPSHDVIVKPMAKSESLPKGNTSTAAQVPNGNAVGSVITGASSQLVPPLKQSPPISPASKPVNQYDFNDSMALQGRRDDFGGDSDLDMGDDEIGDDDFDFFDKPVKAAGHVSSNLVTSAVASAVNVLPQPVSPIFSLTGLPSPIPMGAPTPRLPLGSLVQTPGPTGMTPRDPTQPPTPITQAWQLDTPNGFIRTPLPVATPGALLDMMTSPVVTDLFADFDRKPYNVDIASPHPRESDDDYDVPQAWSAIAFTNLEGLIGDWSGSSVNKWGNSEHKWNYLPATKPTSKRKRTSPSHTIRSIKQTKVEVRSESPESDDDNVALLEEDVNYNDAIVQTDGILLALHGGGALAGKDEHIFWARLCAGSSKQAVAVDQSQTAATPTSLIEDMMNNTLPQWKDEDAYAIAIELVLEHTCMGSEALMASQDTLSPFVNGLDGDSRTISSPDTVAAALFQLVPMISSTLSRDGGPAAEERQQRPVLKGPLTIQQYSELQESERSVAKYGRFSLRKKAKKATEPVIETLPIPDILARHDNNMLSLSPVAVRFWERLRFSPVGGSRDVQWLALCPAGQEVCDETRRWMTDFCTAYTACRLGACQPFALSDTIAKPVIAAHLVPPQPHESPDAQRFRSYVSAVERLSGYLAPVVDRLTDWLVVFIVDPFPHIPNSLLYLSWMFGRALVGMATETRNLAFLRSKIILQVLPIEVILNPDVFRGAPSIGLREVAFSVYSKCRQHFKRPELPGFESHIPNASTAIANLTYTLSTNRTSRQASFSATKRLALPARHSVDADRIMHIAIGSSSGWICATWCEQSGEVVEVAAFRKSNGAKQCIQDVLERTLVLTGRGGVWWRLVFGFDASVDVRDLEYWLDSFSWFTLTTRPQAATLDSPPLQQSQLVPTFNQGGPLTPHGMHMGSPLVRSPASTPTPPLVPSSNSTPRILDGLPSHFIASISLISFNSSKVASQFVPNEGNSNTATSSTSSGVVGRMGFDVADDVVGSFNGRNFPFPLPGQADAGADEVFKEGLQNTSSVVVSNQRIPLWTREAVLPLATGWLVNSRIVDNWTGVHATTTGADVTITAPQHRAYTTSVSQEISLLWHHHNPHAELLTSNYASWMSPPLNNGSNSNLSGGSNSGGNSAVSPHHAAIVRDVLKQYHALRFLRQASTYWMNDDMGQQPWMYQAISRAVSMLSCTN
ncbi:hypothetical protein SmJEL517_g04424 [Synchytrium microbalum]|uniref:Mediator of RNA polymerase II transcription subunit 13 n=1 Tax=Synchytrium microbalum TaxID=1806994 RepID=A0A507BZ45_9FUNG|nr:uncharacterized protein SmJEL517_g04424 [Synchytrium microbalum]TPX32401.1 hypothetical protein SmJEL517_g04424 [Synchytrium microbalum]